MMKDDCIFCKIVKGEIPSYTVYEDEYFKAILDIEPSSDGHTLIIPKHHSDNLYSLDDVSASKIVPVSKIIATRLKDILKCDGINIVQNNEAAAGQTVNHYHMHIIPRYENDEVKVGWKQSPIDKNAAETIVNSFLEERI